MSIHRHVCVHIDMYPLTITHTLGHLFVLLMLLLLLLLLLLFYVVVVFVCVAAQWKCSPE